MAEEWKQMPGELPEDAATVWVRRVWLGAPFLATWDLATEEFVTTSGLVMPWWVVDRWRLQ